MIQNNGQNYYTGQPVYPQNSGYYAGPGMFNYQDPEILKEKSQKKEIRKAAITIGIPFLMIIAFSLFWKTILFFAVSLFPKTRDAVNSFFESSVNQDFFSVTVSSILFIGVFSVAAKVSKKRISDLVPLARPKKGTFFPLVLIGFAFCMFSNLINIEFENFFESFGTEYNVSREKPEFTLIAFVLSVISTAIMPALVEEYACRGIVFGTLLPFGEGFALLTSSIIFGVMHGNFDQMPFAFFVGLILGYVRIRSGSIWPCMIIHFLNNLFSVLSQYSGYIFSSRTREILYIITVFSMLLIGTVGAFLFTKREGALKLSKNGCEIKEKNKYKWFFTSPLIIIATIGFLRQSLQYFT